jgi:GrpB-like predicted nucleotidyltransferase (UPF0157 family)
VPLGLALVEGWIESPRQVSIGFPDGKERALIHATLIERQTRCGLPRITIVPYDPGWPTEFRQIALPLRAAFGDFAARIDHIGSTSVPGLAAKDVIDIQVTVPELDAGRVESLVAPLGYYLREDVVFDHVPPGGSDDPAEWSKLYLRAPASQRRTHVHIRQAGRANQRYALLFRDYLRHSEPAARTYRAIKEALARLHPDDLDAYYDVKDPVCDLIMQGAERWAQQTAWSSGPGDA